jgi:hypothetical protein
MVSQYHKLLEELYDLTPPQYSLVSSFAKQNGKVYMYVFCIIPLYPTYHKGLHDDLVNRPVPDQFVKFSSEDPYEAYKQMKQYLHTLI